MKLIPLFLLSLLVILGGCAGSGAGSELYAAGNAGLVVTIQWPSQTRVLPIAAKAVQVDVLQGGKRVGRKVAVRPGTGTQTTVTLDALPAGPLVMEATAFPELDFNGSETAASGIPQAKGSAPVTAEAGKTAQVTVTMDSTIVRYTISPSPLKVKLNVVEGAKLTATAYDAQNRVVMTLPQLQLTWTSANPLIAVVSPTLGLVRGDQEGQTTVTVVDKESGKSASVQVTVVKELPVETVELSPANPVVKPGTTITLRAIARDKDGNDLGFQPSRFNWTSATPAVATVSAAGIVTGVTAGTSLITATERESGKLANVSVQVQSLTSGRILFSAEKYIAGESREYKLFSCNPDGSDLRAQMILPTPVFAADVNTGRIAYMQYDPQTSTFMIKVVNFDGSNPKVVYTSSGRPIGGGLAWSPDGSRIAFGLGWSGTYTGDGELGTVNVNTRAASLFCYGPNWDRESMSWSPDGTRLAISYGNHSEPYTVSIVPVGGSKESIVAGDAYIGKVSYRPDGSSILTDESSFGSNLALLNPSTGKKMSVVSGESGTATWSPDGNTIAQVSNAPDGLSDLYVMQADGSGRRLVLSRDAIPDGYRLSYVLAPYWVRGG